MHFENLNLDFDHDIDTFTSDNQIEEVSLC